MGHIRELRVGATGEGLQQGSQRREKDVLKIDSNE